MKGFENYKLLLIVASISLLSPLVVNGACSDSDFDKDNSVGFNDFFLFAESFDKEVNETNKQFDLDKNNKIGHDDFFIFAESFGKDCGGVQEAKGIQDVGGVSPLPKEEDCENNLESCYQQISYLIAGAQKIAKLENGKLQYYHSDNLGSSSRITDDNGQVVFSAEYMPFGESLQEQGEEKFTYTGKELDDESGMYYYGARYYDSETGRFTSLDPVPDGVNRYVYVRNNPIRLVDPDGTTTEEFRKNARGQIDKWMETKTPTVLGGAGAAAGESLKKEGYSKLGAVVSFIGDIFGGKEGVSPKERVEGIVGSIGGIGKVAGAAGKISTSALKDPTREVVAVSKLVNKARADEIAEKAAAVAAKSRGELTGNLEAALTRKAIFEQKGGGTLTARIEIARLNSEISRLRTTLGVESAEKTVMREAAAFNREVRTAVWQAGRMSQ